MARKIYDIKPPKTVRKKSVKSSPIEAIVEKPEISINTKSRRRPAPNQKEKKPLWLSVSISLAVIVLIAGIYLFFKLPKAEISIWPKVDILSFQQTISADKSFAEASLDDKAIPAQYFEATKTNEQEFPATGSASNDGKASGEITVYNKCDPVTPVTLSKGAHFLSDSGKSFSYLQKIVIPALTKKLGKDTPGSIKLTVQADESGSSYNIAPAAFSIPKLNGTVYYSCIYATSGEPMTGGYTGNVKKVTEDDINGAKDVLTKKTETDTMEALKAQISSEYILLDNGTSSTIVNASTTTKAGTVAETFKYQVTSKVSALAFKKSDLDKFVKDYIISQMPEGKTLLSDSLKIDYSASVMDIAGGKATLNLDFSSGIYENIDKNSISLSLLGENESQINKTISSSLGEQVSKIEIKFWPFWVSKAPNNQKAIEVDLKF